MPKRLSLIGAIFIGALVVGNIHAPVINKPKIQFSTQNIVKKSSLEIEYEEKMKKLEIERENKKNYRTSDFTKDSEEILLARMLLGEAEDCSQLEKIAIAYTAINRAKDDKLWNGKDLKETILMPYQYSCFNEDLNAKLKNPMAYDPEEFIANIKLASDILSGKYKDPTNGATYYYNPDHPSMNGKTPYWVYQLKEIGRIFTGNGKWSYHLFYKEK